MPASIAANFSIGYRINCLSSLDSSIVINILSQKKILVDISQEISLF